MEIREKKFNMRLPDLGEHSRRTYLLLLGLFILCTVSAFLDHGLGGGFPFSCMLVVLSYSEQWLDGPKSISQSIRLSAVFSLMVFVAAMGGVLLGPALASIAKWIAG